MKPEQVRDYFLELSDGSLPEKTVEECRAVLALSPELQGEFEEFKALRHAAKLLSGKQFSPGGDFAEAVLSKLENEGSFRERINRWWTAWCGSLSAPVSALAVVVCCLLLYSAGSEIWQGFPPSITTTSSPSSYSTIDNQITDNEVHYNDTQISQAVVAILTYIEGSFGALVMLVSGLAGLLLVLLGSARENRTLVQIGVGLLVIALLAFGLRSIMSTFFNTQSIDVGP
jgi:hypothetical protein